MKRHSAFTLIELLIALTLASLLLVAAVPLWREWLQRNRAEAVVQQLITAINLARSEAVKRGQTVTFCPSRDQRHCGGLWQEGQIILQQQQVIRTYAALPGRDQLIWRSSLGKNDRLEFVASGFTNGQKGSFIYYPAHGQAATRIVIEQSGRMRMIKDAG